MHGLDEFATRFRIATQHGGCILGNIVMVGRTGAYMVGGMVRWVEAWEKVHTNSSGWGLLSCGVHTLLLGAIATPFFCRTKYNSL